eukprot:GHVR01156648.1.p1 GENE.GHVR01156648.1~~GHVR01156648.1.p1  ORF type:complete len:332 (+),score=59.79 GHVR01156648.1:28-1023(+)
MSEVKVSVIIQKYLPLSLIKLAREESKFIPFPTCLQVTTDGRSTTIRYPNGIIAIRYEIDNTVSVNARLFAYYEDGTIAADWNINGSCFAYHVSGSNTGGVPLLNHKTYSASNPAMGRGSLLDGSCVEVDTWDCSPTASVEAISVLSWMQKNLICESQLTPTARETVKGWHPRTVELSGCLAFRLEPLRGLYFCFRYGDMRYMLKFGDIGTITNVSRVMSNLWPFSDDTRVRDHLREFIENRNKEGHSVDELTEPMFPVVAYGLEPASPELEAQTRQQHTLQQQKGGAASNEFFTRVIQKMLACYRAHTHTHTHTSRNSYTTCILPGGSSS